MKKIKLFLCVALFGAMSFGAFSAYDYYTMSDEEKFIQANVEALTSDESGGGNYFANSKLVGKSITEWECEYIYVKGEYVPHWDWKTTYFDCCVQSNEYDRCNKSYHSSLCSKLSDSNIRK